MPAYRLDIEYDGTDWHGWQTQRGSPTIQEAIEKALEVALHTPIRITGSGRTDAGVHALGQVAHFRRENPVDPIRLSASLNGILPDSIAVRCITPVDDDFHARYDARWRLYHYHIHSTPVALGRRYSAFVRPAPDTLLMNSAAESLVGAYDFSSFCKTGSSTINRRCTVTQAVWTESKRNDTWVFSIRANRFLHGMVRAIVGTLIEVGQGKRTTDSLATVLAARNRAQAGPAAPARGLVLVRVSYFDDE